MKQVKKSYRRKKENEEKVAVLRLEMNYELAVLYEAMQEGDEEKKNNAIQNLKRIREELMKLNAL